MAEDRYPEARDVIEFWCGSVRDFSRYAGFPPGHVERFLKGRIFTRDPDNTVFRARIMQALSASGVPSGELEKLWALSWKKLPGYELVIDGRRVRISHEVIVEDLGEGKGDSDAEEPKELPRGNSRKAKIIHLPGRDR
jgi:hypothetical protein